jgi:hypothetical protein
MPKRWGKVFGESCAAIFELQDVILQMQLGDDESDTPSLDEPAEVHQQSHEFS